VIKISGSAVLLSKNFYKSKFTYNPVQNEANSILEKIRMKLEVFSKKPENTRESKFTYNPVQNEAKSMIEIKFMKLKFFSIKASKHSRIKTYI